MILLMPFRGSFSRAASLWVCAASGALLLWGAQTLWAAAHACEGTYDLLHPDRRCAGAAYVQEWDYEPLRTTLSELKGELKRSGKLSHLSVYFRDLTHGPRFGVGEYDKFQPASLTKVPVLIAFLHQADQDPSILNAVLSFTGSLNVGDNVEQPDQTILPDTPYTVRELLTKMIVHSDNRSYKLLMREMNAQPPLGPYLTFRDLDVQRMMLAPGADQVSILSYGNLFAVLYNAAYLSPDQSQFALELLSRATFTDGLVAGVPPGTRVAHKFGRRVLEGQDSQLHDCGVVYHPVMDYVLCVMTSGSSYAEQKAAIAQVSRTAYEGVSALHLESARSR